MKKLLIVFAFIMSFTGFAQDNSQGMNSLVLFNRTTDQRDAYGASLGRTRIVFNLDTGNIEYRNGTGSWQPVGSSVYTGGVGININSFDISIDSTKVPVIDEFSPISGFRWRVGNSTQLDSAPNPLSGTVIEIDTTSNSFGNTNDGFVESLSLGLSGSDLTLTASMNGLPDVVSNPLDISGSGISQAEGDARYIQLSEYASDNFTPSLIDEGGGATYSSSTASGSYVKVGNHVTVSIFMNVISTSGSPSGLLRLSGLPFDPIRNQALNVSTFFGGNVSFYSITAETNSSQPYLTFKYKNSLSSNLSSTIGSVSFSGGSITITGSYITSE